MQLTDLRKSLSEMSDEELQEHYRSLRRRRDILQPKKEKVGKKKGEKKESLSSLAKKLQQSAGMSKEEMSALIAQIEQRIENEKQASARQTG